MKRLLAMLLVATASVASAHTSPARRTVSVQAERDAVVVLVTWIAPSGESGTIQAMHAGAGRRGSNARDAIAAQYTALAVEPIEILLDGKALTPRDVESKLVEDPPGSGRGAVAVLLVAPIPEGAHTLSVSIERNAEPTKLQWIDQSEGAAAATSPEQEWVDASSALKPLIVTWKKAP